ncbi:hypothetical protein [Dyella caseinilytica]|uniref:Uncharacterized protein n=1 Tax=Dyella caseinilytica TaxID=1849581 RepID=A0ABX7GRT6_9GAMM|nr:hypothetical protein [Dyella caseinilytica]QRN53141.1 hypothetical protein ISN74_17140 [Dyella caseinilytica]GGA11787.1 hypothetical protein GCM10011408_36500 [Dyella caseinilytica]
MHVDIPKLPMDSFKDLAKHYLMIVLGILTALGLEAWIEHAHHVHAAEAASAQIEAEIHDNRIAIQAALDNAQARTNLLAKVRDDLIQDIKSNATDTIIIQHIHAEAPDGLYLDWRWPTLRHEAWDVAVANQSAGWIDNDKLHRYAKVYAAQNTRAMLATTEIQLVLDGPRMLNAIVDLETGDLQPRELLHSVNQMWGAQRDGSQNLILLAKTIDDAMGNQAASH